MGCLTGSCISEDEVTESLARNDFQTLPNIVEPNDIVRHPDDPRFARLRQRPSPWPEVCANGVKNARMFAILASRLMGDAEVMLVGVHEPLAFRRVTVIPIVEKTGSRGHHNIGVECRR